MSATSSVLCSASACALTLSSVGATLLAEFSTTPGASVKNVIAPNTSTANRMMPILRFIVASPMVLPVFARRPSISIGFLIPQKESISTAAWATLSQRPSAPSAQPRQRHATERDLMRRAVDDLVEPQPGHPADVLLRRPEAPRPADQFAHAFEVERLAARQQRDPLRRIARGIDPRERLERRIGGGLLGRTGPREPLLAPLQTGGAIALHLERQQMPVEQRMIGRQFVLAR